MKGRYENRVGYQIMWTNNKQICNKTIIHNRRNTNTRNSMKNILLGRRFTNDTIVTVAYIQTVVYTACEWYCPTIYNKQKQIRKYNFRASSHFWKSRKIHYHSFTSNHRERTLRPTGTVLGDWNDGIKQFPIMDFFRLKTEEYKQSEYMHAHYLLVYDTME